MSLTFPRWVSHHIVDDNYFESASDTTLHMVEEHFFKIFYTEAFATEYLEKS